MIHRHRASHASAVWLAALVVVGAAAVMTARARAAAERADPAAWLDAFRAAYEARDAAAYAELLSDDFRYVFGDAEGRARWPGGWSKTDELASARHLFEGFVDRTGVARPAAVEITLALGAVRWADDPEHAGDRAHFALAVADSVRLDLRFANGTAVTARGRHAFWLVRGDADTTCASRDAGCWQVRRWAEEPTDAELAPRPAPVVVAVAQGAARLPFAAPNPARLGERVRILAGAGLRPGDVSAVVYDVRGRRVAGLTAEAGVAGEWMLTWDGRSEGGAVAGPGMYFARVRVGQATHVVRLVRVP